jgi:hypothetical protein
MVKRRDPLVCPHTRLFLIECGLATKRLRGYGGHEDWFLGIAWSGLDRQPFPETFLQTRPFIPIFG